jgi:hypothetical protein
MAAAPSPVATIVRPFLHQSPARVSGRGRLVVVSGQIAQDERGELVGSGDPAAQARQVFENLRRCLAALGVVEQGGSETGQPPAGTLCTEASKICPIEASSRAWNCSPVCCSDRPSSSAREKLAIMLGSRASSAHASSRL